VRQKSGGGGGGGGRGGRGGYQDNDRGGYSNQGPPPGANSQPSAVSTDEADPYAQYGGYQNYVALWYQSLMYQQQQAGGAGAPSGAPAPGAQ
jgi:far upstream element-binding protein